MISPKVRAEPSDIRDGDGRQRLTTENPVGLRIIEALDGRGVGWLARETGQAENTIRDAIRRGVAKAELAVTIAGAVDRSVDWLLTGAQRSNGPALVAAADADFVGLPRFDLSQITEAGRGNRIETIPFRKDWLNRRVGTAQGLWVAELPSSYEELGLNEGDAVICSDLARNEVPPDNTTCIFLGDGLFVARFRTRPIAGDARQVGPVDLAEGVQPIARIRARLLTSL